MLRSLVLETVLATARGLARRPASTSWTLGLVAIAIAVVAATVTLASIVWQRPLPFPESENLVFVDSFVWDAATGEGSTAGVAWATHSALRQHPAFRSVGAWARESVVLEHPQHAIVETWKMSEDMFEVLGLKPVIGRLFSADEYDASPDGPVLITWDCWQSRFGGRDDIIGQRLELTYSYSDHRERAVVGVLPRGLALHGRSPEIVLPLNPLHGAGSEGPTHRIVARLAPAGSMLAAHQAAADLVPLYTKARWPVEARVGSVADEVFGAAADARLLGVAALVVLLLAIGSTVALSASELLERRAELAIRLAMGASPSRVLSESVLRQVVLVLLALGPAIPLALWMVGYAGATLLPAMSALGVSAVDTTALPLSLALTAVLITLATTVPALLVTRRLSSGAEREFSRATDRLAGAHRLLLGGQLAACLMLVVCAFLLEQTMWRLSALPLGFDPQHLLAVSISPTTWPKDPGGRALDHQRSYAQVEGLLNAIRRLPGVEAAAAVRDAPFSSPLRSAPFRLPGEAVESRVGVQGVSHQYFQTMRIQIVSGRGFSPADHVWEVGRGQVSVIVSQTLARRFAGPAVGATIMFRSQPHIVVGVAQDVTHEDVRAHERAIVYVAANSFDSIESVVVRTTADAVLSGGEIKRTIGEVDKTVIVTGIRPVDALVEQSLATEVLRARSAQLFGAAGMILAVIGLYALGRRAAQQRRQECALRIVLGAGAADIARLLGRDAGVALAVGLGLGLPLALGAGYGLRHLLYGAAAVEATALVVAVLALVLAVCASLAIPVVRVMRSVPSTILREL